MLKGIESGILIDIKDINKDIVDLEKKIINNFVNSDVDFFIKEKDEMYFAILQKLLKKYNLNLYSSSEKGKIQKIKKLKLLTYTYNRSILDEEEISHEDGNIVIIGDVKLKAKIIAGGNIYIFGSCFGEVLAGQNGDKDAIIIGLKIYSLKLRINNIYATRNAIETEKNVIHQKVYLNKNKICIETINRRY